jgi:hypothetical protein
MSSVKFNNNILEAAARMKDARTTAASSDDTNKRYTSAMWTRYQNRAIRDFLLEWFQKIGPDEFQNLFPEYIKTGSPLTLSSGSVATPADAFVVTELKNSAGTIKFWRIEQKTVQDVLLGIDGLIVPSATRPVFYEEAGNIKTLGITTGDVIPRYIKTHQDIAVSVASAGTGKVKTGGSGAFNASTRTLSGLVMSPVFASGDEGKWLMFIDTTGTVSVFMARIESVVSATSVILTDDYGLPASNIVAGQVGDVLVADIDNVDLVLPEYWHGNIINRMVQFAMQDAKNFVQ